MAITCMSAIRARYERENRGGLTCASCVSVISGSSTETTDGEIPVVVLAQTWPQKRSQSA